MQLDIRDIGSIPESGKSPGEGHGNPLQYSCLENPTDRGAWQAAVHRITHSWTWLKWLSMHTHTHKYTHTYIYMYIEPHICIERDFMLDCYIICVIKCNIPFYIHLFIINWKIIALQFWVSAIHQHESVESIHMSLPSWTSLPPFHPIPPL